MHVLRGLLPARWLWVLALLGAQVLCLFAVMFWYGTRLHHGLTHVLRAQTAAVNRQIVSEWSTLFGATNGERPDAAQDKQRLRQFVTRSRLPDTAHISIVERQTGDTIVGTWPADDEDDPRTVEQRKVAIRKMGELAGDDPLGGWFHLPDGTHYLAVCRLPRQDLLLIADQREVATWTMLDFVTNPFLGWGWSVALAAAVLSTICALSILNRYEGKLEHSNADLEKAVAQRSQALIKTRDAVIFGLAKLADSRDANTGEHLDRVHEFIGVLAQSLVNKYPEINAEYIERLKLAASLHDIGKVGIRDEILLKPGKLTREERAVMQTHGTIGARCLAAIQHRLGDDDFLGMGCEIAAAHHERWDGLGYPYGLQREEIPLPARIVAVADVYDALTTHRVYRDALSHEQAVAMILAGAGTQFDPDVVAAFAECQEEFRQIAARFSTMVASDTVAAVSEEASSGV